MKWLGINSVGPFDMAACASKVGPTTVKHSNMIFQGAEHRSIAPCMNIRKEH